MQLRLPVPRAYLFATAITMSALWPARAGATDSYVAVVSTFGNPQKPLDVPGTKGCQLCHTSDKGGLHTATRPFGRTVQDNGAKGGGKTDLLRSALTKVYQLEIDSDGDTVSDYLEIVFDGTNPNDPESVVVPIEMPAMGGAAGESAEGGAGGEGDAARGGSTHTPPVFVPPPAADLPPPFEHGCAVARSGESEAPIWLAALGLQALFFVRRARRQARREPSEGLLLSRHGTRSGR